MIRLTILVSPELKLAMQTHADKAALPLSLWARTMLADAANFDPAAPAADAPAKKKFDGRRKRWGKVYVIAQPSDRRFWSTEVYDTLSDAQLHFPKGIETSTASAPYAVIDDEEVEMYGGAINPA